MLNFSLTKVSFHLFFETFRLIILQIFYVSADNVLHKEPILYSTFSFL